MRTFWLCGRRPGIERNNYAETIEEEDSEREIPPNISNPTRPSVNGEAVKGRLSLAREQGLFVSEDLTESPSTDWPPVLVRPSIVNSNGKFISPEDSTSLPSERIVVGVATALTTPYSNTKEEVLEKPSKKNPSKFRNFYSTVCHMF